MIIDAHAHMEVGPTHSDTPELLISLMDSAGIDKAVVVSYADVPGHNDEVVEYIAEACKKYQDRFFPYIRLNARFGERAFQAAERALKEYGFKGLKFHAADNGNSPYSNNMVRLLKLAADYDVPVLFHCADEAMCYPLQMWESAKRCPETKIILGHMGGFYHVDDAINVCKRCPNVYLDTSETPYVEKIKEAIRVVGSERILFGTDIPYDNPIVEVEKIKSLNLNEEDEARIFYKNIARLLHLQIS